MRRIGMLAVSAILIGGCMGDVGDTGDIGLDQQGGAMAADIAPTGRGGATLDTIETLRPRRGSGISYHGGPIITGTTNIHYIYYGSWSSGDRAILDNLASSIGGSPYFNINTTYYNGSGTHVSNSVHFSGAVSTTETRGASLSDSDIQAIVAAQNPTDTNGIYFVITSADVNETSGFCTQYCGWHTHATINGRDIKYAFIGNPARCPSSCAAQTTSPNGSVGADGAASILAHELEEAVTDPDLNAWYDSRGEENADKCAWTFGTTYTVNGAKANMQLGNMNYLIQQNWVNSGSGFCALSF